MAPTVPAFETVDYTFLVSFFAIKFTVCGISHSEHLSKTLRNALEASGKATLSLLKPMQMQMFPARKLLLMKPA